MKEVATLLSLLFVGLISKTAAQCPDTWTNYQDSCYIVVQNKVTWMEAIQYCKTFGGYLAELTTQDEINFADMEYKSIHSDVGVWIGLDDILQEGVWTWATSKERADLLPWGQGQPDSISEDDCVMLWRGAWHDFYCTELKYYMCETSTWMKSDQRERTVQRGKGEQSRKNGIETKNVEFGTTQVWSDPYSSTCPAW